MSLKRRVKCANCGMIYDVGVCEFNPDLEITQCPRCKSNACDEIRQGWTNKIEYKQK